jgi:hypothetical protein
MVTADGILRISRVRLAKNMRSNLSESILYLQLDRNTVLRVDEAENVTVENVYAISAHMCK